jgi:hypothetical protein
LSAGRGTRRERVVGRDARARHRSLQHTFANPFERQIMVSVRRLQDMNVRRLVLDVDKAVIKPSVTELAEAISQVAGVEAVNITVTEIDIETVGFNVTVEGQNLSYPDLERAIEGTGAVVHSIDQLVAGSRLLEEIKRVRT